MASKSTDQGPVLSIRDLQTSFDTYDGTVRAVDRVSFDIDGSEMLGLVGESGCGKSLTALSVMGLVPMPPGRVAGSIRLNGRELVGLQEKEMRKVRGSEISMIFQEPMTSLNPVMRIGRQIAEPLIQHQGLTAHEARARAKDMLERVRIPEATRRLDEYAHQLSGGMRQRIMIAMALVCRPAVLIADEPTTALDVTIQAQVLRLMRDLQTELDTSVLLITHDLGVIAESVDRVVVMYAGRKIEEAPVSLLFRRPQHPYTVGLLGSVPKVDRSEHPQRNRLLEIPGIVPALNRPIPGCRFAPRCPIATERCRVEEPPLEVKAEGHIAACWHSDRAMEVASE
ncbi:ABC transporter ATP-binding protein [Pikeienuella piscinae]|uniref:ABC transporter ATP-binding protein n=1 Tax=Pikeienuella piscinae TaxID=2748098 RepID=A0A7L5C041_9RHOB|nr:ABC transporter ATP-binding protein [Pikeienuella piscinae]QIE56743.1 ABC transporter ATP-binding protein [Pikeienuella piscinae]